MSREGKGRGQRRERGKGGEGDGERVWGEGCPGDSVPPPRKCSLGTPRGCVSGEWKPLQALKEHCEWGAASDQSLLAQRTRRQDRQPWSDGPSWDHLKNPLKAPMGGRVTFKWPLATLSSKAIYHRSSLQPVSLSCSIPSLYPPLPLHLNRGEWVENEVRKDSEMVHCLPRWHVSRILVLSIFPSGLVRITPLSKSKGTLAKKEISCILIVSTHVLGQYANSMCLYVLALEDTGYIKTFTKELKY